MKRPIAALLAILTFSSLAYAEGDVVCIIRVNTAASTVTTQGDGGTPCTWVEGSTVAMQCDNAKVCYKPDGGPASTSLSLCANFLTASGNPDPYLIGLSARQKQIALIAAEVGDGGTTTDCKMAITGRRMP